MDLIAMRRLAAFAVFLMSEAKRQADSNVM